MRFYINDWSHNVGDAYEADADPVDRVLGDAPRCPVCNRYVGMMKWLPPYRVKIHVYGRALGDVAYDNGKLIVSDHFRRGFEKADLKGLEFHAVEVVKITPKKFATSEPFCYATIAQGRAAIDIVKSELERGPLLCQECRTMIQIERTARIILEEGSWDGLDAFIPRGLEATIVSERFKEMCDREQITGLMLKAAEDYSFDGFRGHHTDLDRGMTGK